MGQVDRTDVSVASPARIVGVEAVAHDRSQRCGADKKAIVVVVHPAVVADKVVTELGGIALGEEILDVHIANGHLAPAPGERVEAAVRVLLQQVESRQIPLNAIGTQIAKEASAGLFIREDEAAKVASNT